MGYSVDSAGKNYPVQLSSGNKAYVNVPWQDTNTQYTAGGGLQLSGTQFSIATNGIADDHMITNGTYTINIAGIAGGVSGNVYGSVYVNGTVNESLRVNGTTNALPSSHFETGLTLGQTDNWIMSVDTKGGDSGSFFIRHTNWYNAANSTSEEEEALYLNRNKGAQQVDDPTNPWYSRHGAFRWHYASDDRLKFNETELDSPLNLMQKLKPVVYNWKKPNGAIDIGFIAQDIEEIEELKHMISIHDTRKYSKKDGKLKSGFKDQRFTNYEDIFVYNVAATKELHKIVIQEQEKLNIIHNIVKSHTMKIQEQEVKLTEQSTKISQLESLIEQMTARLLTLELKST